MEKKIDPVLAHATADHARVWASTCALHGIQPSEAEYVEANRANLTDAQQNKVPLARCARAAAKRAANAQPQAFHDALLKLQPNDWIHVGSDDSESPTGWVVSRVFSPSLSRHAVVRWHYARPTDLIEQRPFAGYAPIGK